MSDRDLAVLDTSHTARTVAARLSLPIHRKGDDEDEPVVVIVHSEKDLEILEWARGIRKVVGVLAWELPEKTLAKLLAVDLPVLVGHVGQDQLNSLINWGGQKVANDVERERAERLAHIEEIFHEEPIISESA
ncbi:MAG: hypothetical protein U0R17_07305 [Acidimicrobiia bacterium]